MATVERIVQRIKGICLKPKDEWQLIAAESSSTADLLKNYALPLAAVGAVAGFIGMSFLGARLVSGLVGAIVQVALALVGVFVLSLIIDALAPKFGGEKNSAQALKVAVYSFTPGWVASVLTIVPALAPLAGLAGLYGIYLMYLGLLQLMKSPQDKAAAYTVVVVLCAIGVFLVARLITRGVLGA